MWKFDQNPKVFLIKLRIILMIRSILYWILSRHSVSISLTVLVFVWCATNCGPLFCAIKYQLVEVLLSNATLQNHDMTYKMDLIDDDNPSSQWFGKLSRDLERTIQFFSENLLTIQEFRLSTISRIFPAISCNLLIPFGKLNIACNL